MLQLSCMFGFQFSLDKQKGFSQGSCFELGFTVVRREINMPARKQNTSTTSSSQKKSQQYSTDKAYAIKKRLRDLYRQLSPDKKEALLLQRRTRRQQSNNQNFMIHSLVPLSNAQPRLTEQRASTFRIVPGKGKEIVACFSTFEVGSTSDTPTKRDNLEATISITEMSPQTETVGFIFTTCRVEEIGTMNYEITNLIKSRNSFNNLLLIIFCSAPSECAALKGTFCVALWHGTEVAVKKLGRSSCVPETVRCSKANSGSGACTEYCKVSLPADLLNFHWRILLNIHTGHQFVFILLLLCLPMMSLQLPKDPQPEKSFYFSHSACKVPRLRSFAATQYGSARMNEWFIDTQGEEDGKDTPLPAPTKLNALPFSAVERQLSGVEFGEQALDLHLLSSSINQSKFSKLTANVLLLITTDLLPVVGNYSVISFTVDKTKRFQEAIVWIIVHLKMVWSLQQIQAEFTMLVSCKSGLGITGRIVGSLFFLSPSIFAPLASLKCIGWKGSREITDITRRKMWVLPLFAASSIANTTPRRSNSSSSWTTKSISKILAKIRDPEPGIGLPPGEKGELWIKSPTIMQGYIGDPKMTSKTLMPGGWLRTGDFCYIDHQGYFFVVDRLKELIKYKGYQLPFLASLVAPAELEELLQSRPEIVDAAVIHVQGPNGLDLSRLKKDIQLWQEKSFEITGVLDTLTCFNGSLKELEPGVPEINAYLNGVDTPVMLGATILFVKIIGSIGAVSAGLDLGKEEQFFTSFGPVVVNSGFPKKVDHLITFRSAIARTQIDFLLLRKGDRVLCKDCKVISSENLSTQHRLLVMDLSIKKNRKRRSEEGRSRIKWGGLTPVKAWEIGEKLAGMGVWECRGDVDSIWDRAATCIRGTASEVLGVSRGRAGHHRGDWWWNEEVEKKVGIKKGAYAKLVESKDEDEKRVNRKEYKLARKEAKSAVTAAKTAAFESLRGRGRPKKYWAEVIRRDMEQLQLTEDMTLDRKVWRTRIRAED
ncbi:4-coumarate--CoA ligase-like 6 [Capsicum baccatum]|uniref:4-coumarate--CoA ligase-like 6 n=1 Tax=Capsicum baccatum TaxID=33114 RepID=A0A2G2V1K7_CAPBA|nr:4-coumarate--CoA ligase-like 6 [Capsicum baccatum]